MAKDRTYTLDTHEQALLDLLRSGLWSHHTPDETLYRDIDWGALYALIRKQSLIAICWDGMLKLNPSLHPPKPLKFKWYAAVRTIENANLRFNQLSVELCSCLSSHNVNIILLKGQGISTLYPIPTHRQCGDIDLYVDYNDYKQSITLIESHFKKLVIDGFSSLHYNYTINDISVELHHKMLHLHSKDREQAFDKELEKWYPHSIKHVSIAEGDLPTPPTAFNEAYTLLHIYKHLITYGVGFRQIIDWAYIASSLPSKEIVLPEYNDLRELFSSIAVNYLGFPSNGLPHYNGDSAQCSKIVEIIFADGNMGHSSRHNKRYNIYLIDKLLSMWHMVSRWATIYGSLPGHANDYIIGQLRDSVRKLFTKQ